MRRIFSLLLAALIAAPLAEAFSAMPGACAGCLASQLPNSLLVLMFIQRIKNKNKQKYCLSAPRLPLCNSNLISATYGIPGDNIASALDLGGFSLSSSVAAPGAATTVTITLSSASQNFECVPTKW